MVSLVFQISICAIALVIQNADCVPYANSNGQVTLGANGDQTAPCSPNQFFQKIRQVKAALLTLIQKKMGELKIICSTLTSLCSANGVALTPDQLQQLVGLQAGAAHAENAAHAGAAHAEHAAHAGAAHAEHAAHAGTLPAEHAPVV